MSVRCSVCIAVYNGEPFIEKQLTSILNQLSPSDEIIISDDGSTDETLSVIKGLNDNRIKIFRNKKKGIISNYENALLHASGNTIFLSDQDDVWIDGKMDRHLQLHEKFDLVISDAIVVDSNGKTIFPSFFKERKSGKGFVKNLVKNSYIGCCMSFSSTLMPYVLPFPDNIHMHDWWIGLMAEKTGKVVFLEEPYLKYVRHGSNASPTLEGSKYSMMQKFRHRFNLLSAVIRRMMRSRSGKRVTP